MIYKNILLAQVMCDCGFTRTLHEKGQHTITSQQWPLVLNRLNAWNTGNQQSADKFKNHYW